MQINLQLGKIDQEKLQEVVRSISANSRFEQSLERLISRWAMFIDRVENGYDDSIYEYTNYLGTRDLLYRINNALTAEGQRELAKILDPLDSRFRSAAVPARRSLGKDTTRDHEWWWYQVPLKHGIVLHEDLLSEGIV